MAVHRSSRQISISAQLPSAFFIRLHDLGEIYERVEAEACTLAHLAFDCGHE